jgi:hypothetical protein
MRLMGKKTPLAPAPPDPKATADAQAKANINAILASAGVNRINTYTPFGNQEYYVSPTGQYAQYQTPSGPEAERIARGYAINNSVMDRTARVMEATPDTFSFSGLPQGGSAPNFSGLPSYTSQLNMGSAPSYASGLNMGSAPSYASGLDMSRAPDYRTYIDLSGHPFDADLNMGGAPAMTTEIDRRLLPDIMSAGQYAPERKRIEDTIYQRQAEVLDDRFGRESQQLQSQLANQGLSYGSEAWKNATQDFSQNSNQAYRNALVDALTLGGSEFDRAYGQSLSGRQQLVNEQLSSAGLGAQARQQQMAEEMARSGLSAQSRQMELGEQLSLAGLLNQARQGTMAEQLASAGLGAQARQGTMAEQLAGAGLGAQARQGLMAEQLASAGLGAQARQGGIQEQLTAAQYANDARARAITEQLSARAVPFNELTALRGQASAFGLPNFGQPVQYQVAPADISGAINNNYASQQNAYNQQLASRNSTMGNLASFAGNIGAAAITRSDERMKQDFSPVAPDDALSMVRRMPVSEWAYKPEAETAFGLPGGRHIGTMAQDFQEVSGKGDGTSIPTVDAIGMLMAAVQSLADKVDRRAS